jgi:hypothetical protein
MKHGKNILNSTENGRIKGLWNYAQDLLVIEGKHDEIILLDFPSKQRAMEYLCIYFKKLSIPLINFKKLRKATKKDIEKYEQARLKKKPKKSRKDKASVVNRYIKERDNDRLERGIF